VNDHRDPIDPALDALLRAHATESPPAHVDAAILAAAHRAVTGAPRAARATQAWHWWMPLAAAAVIGIVVVGILPLSPAIIDERAPVATTQAPPKWLERDASGNAQPGAPAKTPLPQSKVERETPAAGRQAELPKDRPSYQLLRAVPQAPTAVPPAEAPSPAAPTASLAPSPARSAAGALRKNDATTEPRADFLAHPHPADDWFARIRALRSGGREHEAIRTLAGFRQAFSDADARLPPDLRDWAAALPHAPK
jgi:hypothetical protein